jgi:NitT/TauT family transport system permease protein
MIGTTQSRNALIPLAGSARRAKAYTIKAIEIASPYLFGLVVLSAWEIAVRVEEVPPYILPSPFLILSTLVNDFGSLAPSLWVTVDITLEAFAVSAVAGLLLALLFSSSRWIERTLFPYAIILQVTPIVAIAPLIIIWVKDTHAALLICATLVAFFPVVANAAVGLRSTDLGLVSLFKLYGANRWQTIFLLKLPAALPYYLAGLRIAGGLALIGAVVAEFVAGTGGTGSGLAYRILEASYRLRIPRLFAALVMISVTGIAIFAVLSWISHFVLRRWHESSIAGD